MPWTTPTLKDVRKLTRDQVSAAVGGAPIIPNSVLRVMSDSQSGLAHLILLYIDWLALQLLPDTAETEWLDRHGNIWLVNADGSLGRKPATFASGTINCTGVNGTIVPQGSRLLQALGGVEYETTKEIILGVEPTPVDITALDPGTAGNAAPGDALAFSTFITGLDTAAEVVTLGGGTDTETDDELRIRVLERIREPPMGGDKEDYVAWTLSYPGVTRAWSYPLEMGIGTVTVRFMMDDLRITDQGIPSPTDVENVRAYLDTVRPVAVKDFFVEAPLPFNVDFSVRGLETDNEATRAAIYESVRQMFLDRAQPGQTIWKSWVSEAISAAVGEDHHILDGDDVPMPNAGTMPLLGSIEYD
jgi:uncharacterized phage protein gp47/JayE